MHHAATKHMKTRLSTWKQSSSSSFEPLTPLASTPSSFVPSPSRSDNTPILGSIGTFGRRLTFLSDVIHNAYADSQPSHTHLHRRMPSCATTRRRRLSTFLSSKIRDEGSREEESSIQRLYQQVQEEDSEWFYQTFSKLLDDVVVPNEDNSNGSIGSKGRCVGMVSGNKDDVAVKANDEVKNTENRLLGSIEEDQQNAAKTEVVRPNDTNDNVPIENVESPPSSISGKTKHKPISQQSRQEIEEEDSQALRDQVQQREKKYEGGFEDDDEYEDLDTSDANEGYNNQSDSQLHCIQPPVKVSLDRPRAKKPKTEPDVSSLSTVRLRNAYNNDIENLGPLLDLLNLGYTKKEITVLKPQVLELIFEDRIPKPKKGLPKRWIRLSKLDGYEKVASEETEDEDFEWEVEVVSRTVLDKLVGHDAKVSAGVENSLYASKVKEQESFANEESYGSIPVPPESPSSSQQPKDIPFVKSWGPFTDSRVSDTDEGETTTKRVDVKQRQQPVAAEEDDDAKSRENDEKGKENFGAMRRPTLKRRLDDDIDDGDEYSRSYTKNKSPRRLLNNQERQTRRRPQIPQRELLIDRGDDDEPGGNKFWMDLPTFRDFLRKEAQFRLQILGPDWKESVLDESRWRYDLYKTWLTLLDDGVGEYPLNEYGDRPRQKLPPQPRSRGELRQQARVLPGKELEEMNNYDDASDLRPNRRRTRSSPQEEGGRREGHRSRAEANASAHRRPSPSRGKNYSDLEKSIQRSSQERLRPLRRSTSSPRGDDKLSENDEESNESFDEEYNDAPRPRRTRHQREDTKQGNYVPYDEYCSYNNNDDERKEDFLRRSNRVHTTAPESPRRQYSRKDDNSPDE